jgi:hypothetical protein
MLESPKNFPNECLEDYYLMVITFVETYNSVDRRSEKSSQCRDTRELHLFGSWQLLFKIQEI